MKNRKGIIISLIIAVIFCLPVLKGSFRVGPDTTFHINRVISLATAIKNGDYFPRIFYYQNYNFGYGSPLFYSIIWLYPFALLSLIGTSPFMVYGVMIFAIAFFSGFNMYRLAKKLFKTKHEIYVIITVFVYVVNLFFLSNIYKRGAIGEGFAYVFIPLIIEGIYEIVYADSNKWHYLVYGFSGLLFAHNITFLLMVIIFGLILIIEYKRINLKKIIYIGVAAAFSLLITAAFTLMMFEQLSGGLYRISDYFNTNSMVGIDLRDLFLFSNGENVYLNNTVGPVLLFIPGFVFLVRKYKSARFIKILTVFGFGMIVMTLKFFPWNWFKFMSFLQFPERLLTPVCAFMALSVGYSLSKVKLRYFNLVSIVLIALISILEIGGIAFEYGQITNSFTNDDIKNVEIFHETTTWYNVMEVSSPDYIYKESTIDFKNYGYIIKTNNEEADKEVFDRSNYNQLIFTSGKMSEGAYYILPISYYKGYEIDVFEEETYLMTLEAELDEETGLIKITLPEYDSGKLLKFVCSYKKTRLQNIGENISKFGLLIFLIVRLILKSKVYKWVVAAVNKENHTQAKNH